MVAFPTEMAQVSSLEVKGLRRTFFSGTDHLAGGVKDVTFTLAPGTFFTLLGPSGCGKTTTLRCIAGLELPDEGSIRVGSQVMFDHAEKTNVALNQRNIGMVFQSYAIWPHMSVFENVAFPLRVTRTTKYSKAEIEKAVGEALERVNLAGYQNRSATRLSGGQQQRVALARAIVRRPGLLLLDEPLSNLDATLRDEMRKELKRLQRDVGITTVYVTHDQTEALEMSDQIAVMQNGEIVQLAPPRQIYSKPANEFVASFIGTTNLLRGEALENTMGGNGAVQVGATTVLQCTVTAPVEKGQRLSISIRPEHIRMKKADATKDAADNRLLGTVTFAGYLGSSNRYLVETMGQAVQVSTDADDAFVVGEPVALDFRPGKTAALPSLGEAT